MQTLPVKPDLKRRSRSLAMAEPPQRLRQEGSTPLQRPPQPQGKGKLTKAHEGAQSARDTAIEQRCRE